ncbi:MAG: LacI family DNA-binding transcriptional regulator [Chloroflexota bacterium]|jgi:LacI family transcriptional regulator
MVTIKDVAARAKVSIGTVSNTFTGTRFVKPETAERIRRAAAELGYRPNAIAQGLRSNRTGTLGLVVPDNSNPFFAELAWCIEQTVSSAGLGLMMCNTGGLPCREVSSVELLLKKRVDGIIFISTSGDPKGVRLPVDAGVPLVLVDRDVPGVPVPTVLVDNRQGGELAARHLIQLGHRYVACITGPPALSSSLDRLDGFREILTSEGLSLPEEMIAFCSFTADEGYKVASQLLDRDPRITAIFAANDLMALGVIRAAHDHGRSVPSRLSVVGFDDISLSKLTLPRLTTVRQPMDVIAQQVLKELTQQPANRTSTMNRLVIPVDLVARESTGCVA